MRVLPRKWLVLKGMAVVLGAAALVSGAQAQDLNAVLAKLDASAAKFKSAQADVVWENVQTQPIPDSDKQTGTILFARTSGQVEVAMHLRMHDGKPMVKDMVYANGQGKLYEESPEGKQLQIFSVGDKKSSLDAFLTLGFGGSGADLQKNWTVTYQGIEAVNGVKAAKLQLVPKDPGVAKATPKVILWVDTDKGVGLKQQRFDPSGNYGLITYSNIKLGVPVGAKAFEMNVPKGTQVVNR